MEAGIQIIILACLLVIILLLLVDKVKIIKTVKPQEPVRHERLPDIMGKPVIAQKERTAEPIKFGKMMVDRLKKADAASEVASVKDRQENQATVPTDWTELEADDDGQPEDDRLALGVSVEELMRVGDLLRRDHLSEVQESQTAEIIQKIQGTELFEAMQSSMQGASQKIARLLDKSMSENQLGAVQVKNKGTEQFDIGDFL